MIEKLGYAFLALVMCYIIMAISAGWMDSYHG